MKRIIFIFMSVVSAVSVFAQETYENANIAAEDLNGTARYVGMGGAMDALGADLSTIGTNPAGIGLFRHSQAKVSFGFVSQQGATGFANADKTNLSFDQAGFVYSMRTARKSFVNFAFNYHKSTNFNQILSASNRLSGASQNKLSYLKGANDMFGVVTDYEPENNRYYFFGTNNLFNSVDYLYYNNFNISDVTVPNDFPVYYNEATGYVFNRANGGYIGEYDFNISGNINDRVYLGLTVGIHDVNYNGYGEYSESLIDAEGQSIGGVTVADDRVISGTGFNLKMGVIFRPVENSPFRIGLSVATPTWYDLTTSNHTVLINNTSISVPDPVYSAETYDFKLNTPWKFGLSLGTTVGNYLAIGASYDYADYGNLDSRINEGGGFDWTYDGYYETSASDRPMNTHTEHTLKGVSTVKVGLEYKPEAALAIRLGYNYVSPMYNKNGFKDYSIDSPGTYYASATDYTNWKSTNRITCGVGYTVKKFSVDMAYQYSVQKGEFHPFADFGTPDMAVDERNIGTATGVDNKRHQVLFTLGYSF